MISRINSFSPAFGVVRGSAARQAIKEAGDVTQEIKSCIVSQKNNDEYDIEYVRVLGLTGYGVIDCNDRSLLDGFSSLKEACDYIDNDQNDKSKRLCDINGYEIIE